mmetsp:Transcript_3765/g.8145  ORF Transcript_3765/g.8145 Transcript_3765/m.8145 type:complete len:104 (-) Transcript_3765:60-371(-)
MIAHCRRAGITCIAANDGDLLLAVIICLRHDGVCCDGRQCGRLAADAAATLTLNDVCVLLLARMCVLQMFCSRHHCHLFCVALLLLVGVDLLALIYLEIYVPN